MLKNFKNNKKLTAIKALDVSRMQKLLHISDNSRRIFDTVEQFNNFIYREISLKEFTGLPSMFDCIFYIKNIANIFRAYYGISLYYTLDKTGDSEDFDIIEFISKLSNCTIGEAKTFIKCVYRIYVRETDKINSYRI